MTDAPSHVESTRTVFRGRVLSVKVERVRLPHGLTVDMEVVRHPGSVVLLAMPAPDRVILVRQYRYVVDRWLWELPAGTLEPDEAAAAAAARECQEETGRIADHVEPIGTFFPSPGFCDETMAFFRLTGLRLPGPADPVAAQDADEVLEVGEFSVAEARRMAQRGTIIDMKTALGLSFV